MKKAWIAAALSFALLLGLCACGEQAEQPVSDTTTLQTQAATLAPQTTIPPEQTTIAPEQTTVWIPDNEERDWPETYVMPPNEDVAVPFVAIPTGYGIEDINAEITAEFRDPYKSYRYVNYDWFVNGDILSLCITSMDDYVGDIKNEQYRIYSISISGCRPMSDEEVLAAAQMSYEDFRQATLTASQNAFFVESENAFVTVFQDGEWVNRPYDPERYDASAKNALSLLDSAQPFFGEDGKLWVKCLVPGLLFEHEALLPLTDITLSPAYEQWLAGQAD